MHIDRQFDLSEFFQYEMITSLSIASRNRSTLTTFRYPKQVSLNLTHLSFIKQILDPPALEALSAASKNLAHLTLLHCECFDGEFSVLFKSRWPKLSHLNMLGTKLDEYDLFESVRDSIPNLRSMVLNVPDTAQLEKPFLNVTSSYLTLPTWLTVPGIMRKLSGVHRPDIVDAMNNGLTPNLKCLGISMRNRSDF